MPKIPFLALLLIGLAHASEAPLVPPVAASQPYYVTSPHGARQDEYYWLRDDAPPGQAARSGAVPRSRERLHAADVAAAGASSPAVARPAGC